MDKIDHAAWMVNDQPHAKVRKPLRVEAWIIGLAALQLIADVFQVLGLSI